MQNQLQLAVEDCVNAISKLKEPKSLKFLEEAANLISETFRKGKKLIIAGNGGSLCDAAHFAEELTGFFRHKRPGLPAIVLSEPGHLTCVGNDVGFDYIFQRGIEALGNIDDLFIALTTSGNSVNLLKALEYAQSQGLKTIAFLGKGGGKMKGMADLEWIIDGFSTSDRIQEVHMAGIHILIDLVENLLFNNEERPFLNAAVNIEQEATSSR